MMMQQETINDNSTKKIINNTTRLTDTLFGVRTIIKIEIYSFHELIAAAQGTRYYVLLESVRQLTVSARIGHGITYNRPCTFTYHVPENGATLRFPT